MKAKTELAKCLAPVILFFGCINCKIAASGTLRKVEVYQKIQIPMIDGRIEDLTDSVKVISYKNFVLFQVPYSNQKFLIRWDSTGEQHQTLISNEPKQKYFVHESTDSLGFEYDSLNSERGQKKSVDSFLNTKVFGNLIFYDRKNDSLVESGEMEKGILLEKYVPKVKFDYSYSDSSYFFFSNRFDNLNYTLSRELDSIKQKKLFKVVSVYNAGYDTAFKTHLPRREYVFEIRPATLNNAKEIMDFIKRFEKWYYENKRQIAQ